jgi:4-amino-4-deoxy-L-arabinose transferase-like glycosyltransferase
LLVLTLLASFGLRVHRLGDKSVWWDEGLAVWAARQSLIEIAQWTSADVHPPLYFWMLHFWRLGSGDTEFGLRSLSVAIGVLTVAAVFLLGKAIGGRETGLLAAFLVGVSRFDVWWSQEMRMYALAALLAALSMWAAVRFWERERLTDGLLYIIFTTAGLYTLYLSVSVLVVANLAWLVVLYRSRHRARALFHWALLQAAVLALFAPWMIYALGRMPTWSSASPVALGVFLRIYWTVLTLGIPISVERYAWLTIPLLAMFGCGWIALLWDARRSWRAGRDLALLTIGLSLPAAVVYAVSLPRSTFFYSPQLAPRYLLVFAPAFYVLLAWEVTRMARNRHWLVRTAPIAIVSCAAIYGLCGYYPGRVLEDDYKSLTATLHAYQRQGDEVVLYTDKDWPIFAYHHPGDWHNVPHAQPITPEWSEAFLSPLWNECQGLWLVVTPYASINDPEDHVPAWLASRAAQVVEHRFDDKVLRFYARTEERASLSDGLVSLAPHHIDVLLTTGQHLVGYEQAVDRYRNGDTVHVFLYWQRSETAKPWDGSAELSLAHLRGRSIKQVPFVIPDVPQGQSVVRQQVDLVVPADAASGQYEFAIRAPTDAEPFRFGRVAVLPGQNAGLAAADVDIAHRTEIDFGHGIRLLGYGLETTNLNAGDTLYLTLYWQATQPVERRYKVFTHILGEVYNARAGSFIWGQMDNEPAGNSRPTSTWRAGEVIVDEYAILLDPEAPGGSYTVEIGLYDPATQARAPVLDEQGNVAADHVVLTVLAVKNE